MILGWPNQHQCQPDPIRHPACQVSHHGGKTLSTNVVLVNVIERNTGGKAPCIIVSLAFLDTPGWMVEGI